MLHYTDSIVFDGTSILITYAKKTYLLLGDVHIGYEEALNKQGVFIPRTMTTILMQKLQRLLLKHKPDTVVITGDLKHEFGTISRQEWKETLAFLDSIASSGAQTILIKGNHDTVLDRISSRRQLDIVNHYMLGSTYITHGNTIPTDSDIKHAKTIIIGHEHPAVTLSDGHKQERFKAFLVGSYDNKTLIVHPSMHPSIGTDVLKARLLSPFLKRKQLGDYEVYLVSDEPENVHHFGKLRGFRVQK